MIGTVGTIWMGGTMVLIEQFTPDGVLEAIRSENANLFFYVPTVLGAVLEAARKDDKPAPSLVRVLGGGANVPGPMIEATEKLFGATTHNLFGQTELSPSSPSPVRRTHARTRSIRAVIRSLRLR